LPDRPRFGPAGIPQGFKETKSPTYNLPCYLQKQRLDALEYEAVRWGQKPQVNREAAEKLGKNARDHDVWLTLHASYYVNLVGSQKIIEASKRRLIAAATAAKWMKAHTITVHPGYYSQKRSHRADLVTVINVLRQIVELMQSTNIKATLGLETSGRLAQLGTLEEIITICESVEQTEPVVDWAHLYARRRGNLTTHDDFRQIVEKIEGRLGSKTARDLHCHFSLVEYTFRGEKRHHPLMTPGYGPRFDLLADIVVAFDLKPTIISETPLLDIDAKRMQEIVYEKLKAKSVLR